jgi:xanthine/uracil permease
MSGFLGHVADAALPVAIGLLLLATAAHGMLLAHGDHSGARRYLEPLSTWCLVALATHTLALIAAGRAGVFSLVVALALGVAAALLRSMAETDEPSTDEPETQPFAPPATPAAPIPAAAGTLWARERSPITEAR